MYFDTMACGKRIKEARRQKGLTQLELSNSLHISAKYLSRIETGAQCASLEIIIGIAEQLGVSIDRLVFGKGNDFILNNSGIRNELRNIIEKLRIIESTINGNQNQ